MIFSTFQFICVFLPIIFGLYYLCLKFDQILSAKVVLVIGSFVFYAIGSGPFFPFFVASVFANFAFGMFLANATANKRLILIIGLLGNIALLGYFKYTDFLIFNINLFIDVDIPYKNIVLPIGISFFTFQLIAFLVDSFRAETKGYDLIDYLLFITFFPQLIVGPIVHHKDVVPQYKNMNPNSISSKLVAAGLFLFAMGCAKKLALADPMTTWAQTAFDNAQDLTMLEAWASSVTFTMSYYFDLSGYADMAIGLGLIFGITIPRNFNSPYKARNFADYWRRWHMTLSKFLGAYIFSNVHNRDKGNGNFYWALFVTFFVSGVWHGAGWNFVVWGVVNGIFVIASHAMRIHKKSLPFILAWFMTFLGVVATRTLFVSDDFGDALFVLSQAFDISSLSLTGNDYIALKQPVYLAVSFLLVLAFPNSQELIQKFKPDNKFMIATVVLLLIGLFNMSYVRGFLYFQF